MEHIILFYLINQHQNSKTYIEFEKKMGGGITIIIFIDFSLIQFLDLFS